MLKVLVEKGENIFEQMGNFSREVKIIKSNKLKMLRMKNSNREE